MESCLLHNNMTVVMTEMTLPQEGRSVCWVGRVQHVGVGWAEMEHSLALHWEPCAVCTWSPLSREAAQLSHPKVRIWIRVCLMSLDSKTTTASALLPCSLRNHWGRSQCGEEGAEGSGSSPNSWRLTLRELCGLQSLPTNAEKQAWPQALSHRHNNES